MYVQKKIKDESVFTKGSLICPLVHSVLHLYTDIYKKKKKKIFTRPQCFIVAPPSISAFAEDTDSTERSPANKNPNGASGTCPTGDRPVLQTRSFVEATGSRPDGRPDCP